MGRSVLPDRRCRIGARRQTDNSARQNGDSNTATTTEIQYLLLQELATESGDGREAIAEFNTTYGLESGVWNGLGEAVLEARQSGAENFIC